MNSIEKALLVLMSFTPENKPLGTVEISQRLELHKATVSRILATLKKQGFVDQDPATRRYRLGPAAAALGRAIGQSLNGRIVALAQPHIDRLRDLVGETVHLEVVAGDQVYLAYAARGPRPVAVSVDVGDRMSANAHAGAKVIMAFSPPERVKEFLAGELTSLTSNTVTDPKEIKDQYAEIRRLGVGFDRAEFDPDVDAVAAPVFNHEDRPVAAVTIVGPSYRMDLNPSSGTVLRLKETAAAISAGLLSSE